MPDDVKPEVSSEEELQAGEDSAAQNDVREESPESPGAEADIDAAAPADSQGDFYEAKASTDSPEDEAEVSDIAEEAADIEPDIRATEDEDDMAEGNEEAAMMAMLEAEGKQFETGEAADDRADDFPDLSGIRMEEQVANPAEFQQLNSSNPPSGVSNNIDMLFDVKMPVSIELGRTEMQIGELLGLGPGSVVELNKLAGEPVDLLVNNRVIARGEVVVVDENFGVRITQLLSPEERVRSLAEG